MKNLLRSRRQVLHRRIGEALRDKFAVAAAVEPELLAHDFTQAGMNEAAVEWLGKAGQRSLERSALCRRRTSSGARLTRLRNCRQRQRCATRRSSFRSRL